MPSSNWILFRDETKKEEVKEVEEVKPALDKTCVFEGLNEDKLKEGDDEDKVEVKANKEEKRRRWGRRLPWTGPGTSRSLLRTRWRT